MDDYRQANLKLWNDWTALHEKSEFYDIEGFKAGKIRLRSIEREELGDVTGKSLLHLQCHFGLDTLSWARLGAKVTGVDFSDQSIALARSLSEELSIPARFVCSDVDHLPSALSGEFDIVFTSYGVLHWLSDLRRWAGVVARFLKPGGIFYIVEDHPFMRTFDADPAELKIGNPYHSVEPNRFEMHGSYAASPTGEAAVSYGYNWSHGLGEVIDALIEAGLRIEFLHEFSCAARAKFPFMEQGEDGWWRFPKQYATIPLLFSLQARKNEGDQV